MTKVLTFSLAKRVAHILRPTTDFITPFCLPWVPSREEPVPIVGTKNDQPRREELMYHKGRLDSAIPAAHIRVSVASQTTV
jgi:hypothetical protein